MKVESIKIGIVIINYNGADDTLECLDSLKILLKNKNYLIKVFLIDNKSHFPINELRIKQTLLGITYIKNEKNEGFAEGNNIGIRQAIKFKSDYIILLNNDTKIIDDSFFRLINEMDKKDDIGIGGIVNYYYSNPSKIWQAGILNDFRLGKPKLVNDFDRDKLSLKYVDYVPGSSMVIKKEVFNRIGLLDPRYFAYYEENDFCMRAKKAGYRTVFLQNSRVLHKVGHSSNSKVKNYLRARNMLLFYSTYGNLKGLFILAVRYTLKTLWLMVKNPTESWGLFRSLLIGFRDFFRKNFYAGSISNL